MNYRKIVETVSLGSVTMGAKTTYRIQRRRLWLEGIFVRYIITTAGSPAVTAQSTERAFTAANEITLDVHDGAPRQMIRARGTSLIEMAWREGMPPDGETLHQVGATMAVSETRRFQVPLLIVPPWAEDPIGSFLALPLASLQEDPVLTLDVPAGLTILTTGSTTNISSIAVELEFHYRDITAADPLYFPQEIVSNLKVWSGGQQDYELAGTGFLVSLLAQNWSDASTRGTALADTTTFADEWLIYYGQTVVDRRTVRGAFMGSEMFGGPSYYGHATANGNLWNNASWFRDFLRDRPFAGAFNAGSALNLNTLALGGDKARVVASNSVANAKTYFTHRKLLAASLEKLVAV